MKRERVQQMATELNVWRFEDVNLRLRGMEWWRCLMCVSDISCADLKNVQVHDHNILEYELRKTKSEKGWKLNFNCNFFRIVREGLSFSGR